MPNDSDEWLIEQLDKRHLRGEFRCGRASLDNFLNTLVSQYEKRNLGRTYVAVRRGENRVHGYYTLATAILSVQDLPDDAADKPPRHPIPAILLARLAVDQLVQGRGLGNALIVDALKRCLDLSAVLGVHAVEVDAIDEQAENFYRKQGFISLLDKRLHLYFPISAIRKAYKTG